MESERKYVERLAVEDFGSTHVGKVRHCSRFLDFLSLEKRKMDLNHSTCIWTPKCIMAEMMVFCRRGNTCGTLQNIQRPQFGRG